jgi:phosphatidate cytidylyltransferase
MNQYLRSLSATQQVGAMFLLVFGCLALAGVLLFLLTIRERPEGPLADARRRQLAQAEGVLRTSWAMAIVFWIGWLSGPAVATVLFALVSFFALREFLTLSPTRRSDHRGLVLSFFVVLPVQFVLVGMERFDLFTVFIPVYVFLALPAVGALANDPQRFLERNAKLQWGIMVCVYGLSHVPALLLLDFAQYDGRNAFLVIYLVLVVQVCMVVQYFAANWRAARPVAPAISSSFQWPAWWLGIVAGSLLGALLAGVTPFAPGQGFVLSAVACVAGSFGHLVMKAIRRDRGIPSWGVEGESVTGTGGLLDRIDALCFAAPIFFHSVRWYFAL